MLDDTILSFLKAPRIARMSTIDGEGFPHTVPVWFDVDGDDLIVISVRDTRKVAHILANAKGAITIGGDSDDDAGYLFKGTFRVQEDADRRWMKRLINRYEKGEQAERDAREWATLDMVVLRLTVNTATKVM